jgi:hypothetical protein
MTNFNTEIITLLFPYINDIKDVYHLIRTNKQFLQAYRNTNVLIFCKKAKNRQEMLKIFISYYEYLPKQGSIEWVLYRQGSDLLPPVIGGSELKKLVTSPKQVAESKLKINGFTGNIYTRWGNLFEEIFGQIIDLVFHSSSQETGSIPGLRNIYGQIIQSYSPDRLMTADIGLMLHTLLNTGNGGCQEPFKEKIQTFVQDHLNNVGKQVNILFEFKCPPTRLPDGYIHTDYILQPPLGLATIPVVDIAIFANNIIRKCSIEDFDLSSNYDKKFHTSDIKNNYISGKPMFMGIVAIYKKPKLSSAENYLKELEKLNPQTIKQQLDQYMKTVIESANSVHYLTELQCANVASLTTICLEFILQNNYHDSIISEYLIEKLKPADPVLFKNIINDIIDLYYKTHNFNFDGIDYGKTDEKTFSDILTNVIDQRFSDGYKAYYDAGILTEKDTAMNFQISNFAKSNADCQVWLQKRIREFMQFCRINNYQVMGVIPYKVFKICMIPVFRQPDFIEKYKTTIEDFTETLQEIKQRAREQKVTDLPAFYQHELELIYGEKKSRRSRSESPTYDQKSRSESPPKIYDQETTDEFNNL